MALVHAEAKKRLVVLEPDVVGRLVFLDQVVFKDEGFRLVGRDDEIHLFGQAPQIPRRHPELAVRPGRKVGGYPLLQVHRFSYVEDVIAGIDHLGATGLVDVDRVGSSGTSYGGYFSAWAGARHADRFRAAITFAGITNWISFTGTTDIPYEMSIVHWDFWWFDNPGVAWDRSPLAHVDENAAPTLVAHGAVDERVHPEQSYEFHRALEFHGVPTGLVVYPREPHGLRERAHQLDFMHRVLEWLDRHVKAASPATM